MRAAASYRSFLMFVSCSLFLAVCFLKVNSLDFCEIVYQNLLSFHSLDIYCDSGKGICNSVFKEYVTGEPCLRNTCSDPVEISCDSIGNKVLPSEAALNAKLNLEMFGVELPSSEANLEQGRSHISYSSSLQYALRKMTKLHTSFGGSAFISVTEDLLDLINNIKTFTKTLDERYKKDDDDDDDILSTINHAVSLLVYDVDVRINSLYASMLATERDPTLDYNSRSWDHFYKVSHLVTILKHRFLAPFGAIFGPFWAVLAPF